MKKMKKLAILCMAFIACFSMAFAVGCGEEENNSSSDSSSSSSSPIGGEDEEDEKDLLAEENADKTYTGTDSSHTCTWGKWEKNVDPTCTQSGSMIRYCTENEEHYDRQYLAPRGHDYGKNGTCIRCEKTIKLPSSSGSVTYINPEDPASGIFGSGDEFTQYYPEGSGNEGPIPNTGRYYLTEGEYYEIQIDNDGVVWFEFGVDGPGQFAVYSLSNPNEVSLSRYYATFATSSFAYDATVQEDGNFLVTINDCTSTYYNVQWTALFKLSGTAGDVVKFHIKKIADEAWASKTIRENVYATEIDNTKAQDPAEGYVCMAFGTESDAEYYFDETVGYYRMGTEDTPGEIIYAAISKVGAPIFGEGNEIAFTTLLDQGNPLTLFQETLPSGDNLIYDYASMFMAEASYGGTPGNNYQEFVNKDGLYPVTQELYEYLTRYADLKTPLEGDNAWLAACYYYELLVLGEAGRPIEITEVGTVTNMQHAKREYNHYLLNLAAGTYTFQCTTDDMVLILGDKTYKNQGETRELENLTLTVEEGTPFTFQMGSRDGSIIEISFTISAN